MVRRGAEPYALRAAREPPLFTVLPSLGAHFHASVEASLQAKRDEGGNTRIEVEAKHLAPANKIRDDASAYVVWVEPLGGPPQNVGTLEVNDFRYPILRSASVDATRCSRRSRISSGSCVSSALRMVAMAAPSSLRAAPVSSR